MAARCARPTCSCAAWRTACRCCATHRPRAAQRRAGPHAHRRRPRLPGLGRAARGITRSSSGSVLNSPRCWPRAGPGRARRAGQLLAQPARRQQRTAAGRGGFLDANGADQSLRDFAQGTGVKSCPTPRVHGWIAYCRRCCMRPRARRNLTPRSSACLACCRPCCAGPAIWRCWTNSPARWRVWSMCWRAARCWPSAWLRIRCCWTNCWMCACPVRCPMPPACWPNASRCWRSKIGIGAALAQRDAAGAQFPHGDGHAGRSPGRGGQHAATGRTGTGGGDHRAGDGRGGHARRARRDSRWPLRDHRLRQPRWPRTGLRFRPDLVFLHDHPAGVDASDGARPLERGAGMRGSRRR